MPVCVYMADDTEIPITTIAALRAAVPLMTRHITTRAQALAWAQVVGILLAVQVLTPGWRHTWMEEHGVRGLVDAWLTFEGASLRFLAYPLAGNVLTPVLLQVSIDLATMHWETAVLHDESGGTDVPKPSGDQPG